MKFIIFLIFSHLFIYIFCQEQKTKEANSEEEKLDKDHNIFLEFFDIWIKMMPDFIYQYSYYIPVKYKSQSESYENITNVPCNFQAAYLLDGAKTKDEKIEIQLIAPNGTILFQNTSVYSFISINLTEKGLYTIKFNNKYLNREARPNLMVNSGQNVILGKEKLTETESRVDSIISFLKKYEQETKLSIGYRRRGKEELSKTNKYFFLFALIETIVLISVSIWQYFYLKHLFEIKGSL